MIVRKMINLKFNLLIFYFLMYGLVIGQTQLSGLIDCKGPCEGLSITHVSSDTVYLKLNGKNLAMKGVEDPVELKNAPIQLKGQEESNFYFLSGQQPKYNILLDSQALYQYKKDKEEGKKVKLKAEWFKSIPLSYDSIPQLNYLEGNYDHMNLNVPVNFLKNSSESKSFKIPYDYVLERFTDRAKDVLFGFDKKQIEKGERERFIETSFLYTSPTAKGGVVLIFDTKYFMKIKSVSQNGNWQKEAEYIVQKSGDYLLIEISNENEVVGKYRVPKVSGNPAAAILFDRGESLVFIADDIEPVSDKKRSHLWFSLTWDKKVKSMYQVVLSKETGKKEYKELFSKPKKATEAFDKPSYFYATDDEYTFLFIERKVKIKKFIHHEIYEKFQVLRYRLP